MVGGARLGVCVVVNVLFIHTHSISGDLINYFCIYSVLHFLLTFDMT